MAGQSDAPNGPDAPIEGHVEPTTFEDAVYHIVAEIAARVISKQRDYGHENINVHGELGIEVRVHDKAARLHNLHWQGGEPENESVEDTWMDIGGYAILVLMRRRGLFDLPLAEESLGKVEPQAEQWTNLHHIGW